VKPRVHPADEPVIAAAFNAAVNMAAEEIEEWLATDKSRSVGAYRPGERESVGRQSARRIVAILGTSTADLTESDYVHMRKVVGFVKRHGANRPLGDVRRTRWRYALMNWGHDPTK
jgi:hypothetical protein